MTGFSVKYKANDGNYVADVRLANWHWKLIWTKLFDDLNF